MSGHHIGSTDLAAMKRERAKSWTLREALTQLATVARRELEQRPVEVHAAVTHAVRHLQVFEMRQARQNGAEVEVVDAAGVVVGARRGGVVFGRLDAAAAAVLGRRQQLVDLQATDVVG